MFLTKPTKRAKRLIHKTLQTLTSFLSKGYQKLPKSPSFNPFTSCTTKTRFPENFPHKWEDDHDPMKITSNEGPENASKHTIPPPPKKKKARGGGCNAEQSCRRANGGSCALAMKMKELDMEDDGDLEQALDVEEAIHYYSRLRSPIYLDIVDSFFMDMYSEMSVPMHNSSICSSKRRKGSFRF